MMTHSNDSRVSGVLSTDAVVTQAETGTLISLSRPSTIVQNNSYLSVVLEMGRAGRLDPAKPDRSTAPQAIQTHKTSDEIRSNGVILPSPISQFYSSRNVSFPTMAHTNPCQIGPNGKASMHFPYSAFTSFDQSEKGDMQSFHSVGLLSDLNDTRFRSKKEESNSDATVWYRPLLTTVTTLERSPELKSRPPRARRIRPDEWITFLSENVSGTASLWKACAVYWKGEIAGKAPRLVYKLHRHSTSPLTASTAGSRRPLPECDKKLCVELVVLPSEDRITPECSTGKKTAKIEYRRKRILSSKPFTEFLTLVKANPADCATLSNSLAQLMVPGFDIDG